MSHCPSVTGAMSTVSQHINPAGSILGKALLPLQTAWAPSSLIQGWVAKTSTARRSSGNSSISLCRWMKTSVALHAAWPFPCRLRERSPQLQRCCQYLHLTARAHPHHRQSRDLQCWCSQYGNRKPRYMPWNASGMPAHTEARIQAPVKHASCNTLKHHSHGPGARKLSPAAVELENEGEQECRAITGNGSARLGLTCRRYS